MGEKRQKLCLKRGAKRQKLCTPWCTDLSKILHSTPQSSKRIPFLFSAVRKCLSTTPDAHTINPEATTTAKTAAAAMVRPGAGGPRTAPTAHHFLPRPRRSSSSSVYERLGSLRWRTYPLGTVQSSLDTRTRTESKELFFFVRGRKGKKRKFQPLRTSFPSKNMGRKIVVRTGESSFF